MHKKLSHNLTDNNDELFIKYEKGFGGDPCSWGAWGHGTTFFHKSGPVE